MNEIWKDVKDFPSYEVSNLGNVRNKKTKRVLKQYQKKGGYMNVRLSKNNKKKDFLVHRLVAAAFLGESDLTVHHKDENPANNALSNLMYLSMRDNTAASQGHKVICLETGELFDSMREAARQKGISYQCIANCLNNKQHTAGGLHWQRI